MILTRNLIALALGVAVVVGYQYWAHQTRKAGALAERQRLEHVADLQREANRARSRAAETVYAERVIYRDRFITRTKVEVRHATADLATCPLGPRAVGLLNAAAECAADDRSAACGAGDGVRAP
jgi:hypothetical protein